MSKLTSNETETGHDDMMIMSWIRYNCTIFNKYGHTMPRDNETILFVPWYRIQATNSPAPERWWSDSDGNSWGELRCPVTHSTHSHLFAPRIFKLVGKQTSPEKDQSVDSQFGAEIEQYPTYQCFILYVRQSADELICCKENLCSQ